MQTTFRIIAFFIFPIILIGSTVVYANSATVSVSVSVRAGVCGDGIVEVKEDCEANELRGRSCINFGFVEGEIKCSNQCRFDTSRCFNPPLFTLNIYRPQLISEEPKHDFFNNKEFLEVLKNLKYNIT